MTNAMFTELSNAMFDFKNGKFTSVGNGKSFTEFAIDASFGAVKGTGKVSFNRETKDVVRDGFWDIGMGQIKNQYKDGFR
jgi:hypothetical protein